MKYPLDNKSEFFEILNIQNCRINYRVVESPVGVFLTMNGHEFPKSLTETEFLFIKDLIIRYNLKNGYEVATGFGVSTLAAGLGFKQTGGKLITLDSYIEEYTQDYKKYWHKNPEVYKNSDGWKSVNCFIEHFGLQEVITPKVGWSPDDVGSVIEEYTKKSFDFAFIDGGHFSEQIIKDVEAILPYMDSKFVMVFHDTFPNFFTEKVMVYLEKTFGERPKIMVPPPYGLNLSIIIKK
jgi:predicted O-methyltransferase YrrM